MKERLIRLLRWSEKYTKTDMVYLASGWSWSVVGQIASTLCTFAFAVIVARVFPQTAYGEYKYILATVALLSTFSLTGLGTAVFQSVSRGFDGSLKEGFWLNLRWSALVFLGAFAMGGYYLLQGNAVLGLGILIGGSLSPLLTSANLSGMYLSAKKDFVRANIYFGVVETMLSTGVLIAAILLSDSSLILVAAYFIGNTLATFLLYWRIVRLYKPDESKKDPEMLTYGKHLSIMSILSGLAGNIDQILLFQFVGPVELAIYNFAKAIPDQAKGPLKSLDKMIQAQFANRPEKDIRSGMRHKTLRLFAFSVVMTGLYIAVAPFIYKIFFPVYASAALYSQIYALSYLGTAFTPAGSYLTAKKRVKEQYMSSAINSLLWMAALAVGAYFWGLLGLVIALTLSRFSAGFVSYILYVITSRKHNLAER